MVRCADCGFLARLVEDRPEYAGLAYRTNDFADQRFQPKFNERVPVCYVQAYSLRNELFALAVDAHGDEANARLVLPTPQWKWVWQVIDAERDCELFMEWWQGRSAEDHRVMNELERLRQGEREQRVREEERAERLLREMREREDRRDERVERLQKQLHSRELWVMGAAVTAIVTIATIGSAILEGIISRGWSPF